MQIRLAISGQPHLAGGAVLRVLVHAVEHLLPRQVPVRLIQSVGAKLRAARRVLVKEVPELCDDSIGGRGHIVLARADLAYTLLTRALSMPGTPTC
jgi:hypothetical protein